MPLNIISGFEGSGKSLFMVYKAYYSQIPVVANFHLFDISYTFFSLVDFLEGKYANCLVLLDEIYNYIDARNSMSSINKEVSYKTFQNRKNSLNIYGCVQLMSVADIRFKQLCKSYYQAIGLVRRNESIYYKYRLITRVNRRYIKKSFYIPLQLAKVLYNFYDTHEIIEVEQSKDNLIKFRTREEQIEYVDNIVKDILKLNPTKKEITHSYIKDYLFRNNIPMGYEEYIYFTTKQLAESEEK